ncbi:hypothetical protein [Candidatus Leptofilum sp.]|uniref:hypothetical protein n=1 Tax=Candidatus Leptofilum sp. TaxID=3241576 RepID=UPI003B59F69B
MAEQYKIKLQNNIDGDWSSWLGNFELTHTDAGHTILIGEVEDQAALYGLLARIRDLGISILLVARLHPATGNQSHLQENE